MQHFKISEQQVKSIWDILSEVPSKHGVPIVDILRGLPAIVEAVAEDVETKIEE